MDGEESLRAMMSGADELWDGPDYDRLKKLIQEALEDPDRLSSPERVALALEVLRTRQLEGELNKTRENIASMLKRGKVRKDGGEESKKSRLLRCVMPASSAEGIPLGIPMRIQKARLVLNPTAQDPSAVFLCFHVMDYVMEDQSDVQRQG